MSIRVSGRAVRGFVALIALTASASLLAGCSGLGGFSDSMATGSVGGSAAARTNQPMPSPLNQQPAPVQVAQADISPSGTGRYLPPANIGSRPMAPVSTASVQGGPIVPGTQGPNTVSRQELAPLSTTAARSNNAMPAVQTTQPSVTPVQTANAAPVPAAEPASTVQQPKLQVVADNAYKHTIQSGESLYVIARRYDVSVSEIVQANGLASADKIVVGQKLVIPGKTGPAEQQVAATPQQSLPEQTDDVTSGTTPVAEVEAPTAEPTQTAKVETPAAPAQPMAESGNGKFRWPLSGSVITDFSTSKTGINIAAAEGTAIRAAETGTVIYVGSAVEGYGNLILIKHDNGYVSAYAHLKDISVAKGDSVGRGDTIGSAGMTGAVSKPQLHFELRKGATPVDPTPLLAS